MKTDRLSVTGKYLTMTAIIDGDDCHHGNNNHHGCDKVDDDNYQNDEGKEADPLAVFPVNPWGLGNIP